MYESPEEDWRTYHPKRCEYDNKDEDNSPKTLIDKNLDANIRICWKHCFGEFYVQNSDLFEEQ